MPDPAEPTKPAPESPATSAADGAPAPAKPPPPARKEPPRDRRGFFGELFRNLAVPLVDVVDARFNLGLRDMRDFVRPPGSVKESLFLERCGRTQYCVESCPVEAIVPMPRREGKDLAGTPMIVAETQPCVTCYDLACMAACPTGAILPAGREEIRIATAKWKDDLCLRTAGEECNLCVERCPMRERVIKLDEAGRVRINPDTCTGCGVCVYVCPAEPKAIVLEPV